MLNTCMVVCLGGALLHTAVAVASGVTHVIDLLHHC